MKNHLTKNISIKIVILILLITQNTGTTTENYMSSQNKELSDHQKHIIFNNGTEKPFDNAYWDNHSHGIYVDVVNGKPLFSSKDKFDSGSGWPSFTKPIQQNSLKEKQDNSYGMSRIEIRSKESDIHLGHLFNDGPKSKGGMRYCINSAALKFIPKEELASSGYEKYANLFTENTQKNSYQKAIISGGCFWGMEKLFENLEGVITVINGYTGGHTKNPTYKTVSSGDTRHAESVEITFDTKKTSYEKILRFFFKIHNPTTINQQGNDRGSQYRSAIFYTTPEQKKIAETLIKKANNSGIFPGKIITSLEKFDQFYPAEEEHQNYLRKYPNGYTCHFIREDWIF